jgi:hypothetical protein
VGELWLDGWAAWSPHPKAGRFAGRFRVGTKLLPDLVLSEDKTMGPWDEMTISTGPHHPDHDDDGLD